MTSTTTNILGLIKQCSKEEQETILTSLVNTLAVPSESFGVLQVPLEQGFLGVYFPRPQEITPPPPMTPEERAELQHRIDTIEDSVSLEEMLKMIEEEEEREHSISCNRF